nr:structural protein [Tolivirales sp.]
MAHNKGGKRKRNTRKTREFYNSNAPESLTQSGLANLPNPMPNVHSTPCISDQAKEFCINYIDPCGEHIDSIDAGRVPDAAIPSSAAGFLRSLVTLQFPWQSQQSIDLTGKTYSFIVLQTPLFRSMAFVLADAQGREASNSSLTDFCLAFSKLAAREDALYPNWLEYGEGRYWTAIDTIILRNIEPPSDLGVSKLLDSYRFSSQGINIMFNTPDLLNQGTFSSFRYVPGPSVKTFTPIVEGTGTELSLVVTHRMSGGLNPSATFAVVTKPSSPFSFTATIPPPFTGGQIGLPLKAPYDFIIDSADGTARVSFDKDDDITFSITSAIVTPGITGINYFINNVTKSTTTQLLAANSTGTFSDVHPIVASNLDEKIVVVDHDVTVFTLPPVEQADMFQNNPKTSISLAKATGGVYIPGTIIQPVFSMTSAAEYRKVLFTTSELNLNHVDLFNYAEGWRDTCDKNFCINIINFNGIPYAAKPFIKINRSVEMVPSQKSILGITTMGCPQPESLALEMARAFTECQPHGYPSDYNGLGILFEKVMRVFNALPAILRTGDDVVKNVRKVCESEAMDDLRAKIDGLFRSARYS